MELEKQAAELWRYYSRLAKSTGENREGKKEPYSLEDFFPETLKKKAEGAAKEPDYTLLLAFLRDSAAVQELNRRFGSAQKPDLQGAKWVGRTPNDSQREAIRAALAYPISFIQGPPGTGKTATILNLLGILQENDKTAAVVSSNKEALENIVTNLPPALEGKVARLGRKGLRREFWEKHHPNEKRKDKEDPIGQGTFRDFQAEYGCSMFTSTLHSLQRCFSNGTTCQYDYVIIDEASQVSVLCGLVAMSSAKHLVVVGDEKQLSAFIKKDERLVKDENLTGDREIYCVKTGESNFLSLALDVFVGADRQGEGKAVLSGSYAKAAQTLLAEHYRCHPGIIEFCNKSFYDGRLVVRTMEYDKTVKAPIRVLWYNGDYCEGVGETPDGRPEKEEGKREEKNRAKRHNSKQVSIFVEEEWPRLLARLKKDREEKDQRNQNKPEREKEKYLSVCILTPFNDQITALAKVLNGRLSAQDKKWLKVEQSTEEKQAATGRREKEEPEEPPIPMLTIHKAQGKEYDIVYLLPAEDAANWQWPWSQGERLVNVAVSRAKRELCLIVSSLLMDEATRKNLGLPALPEQSYTTEAEKRRQLWIQKLVAYAGEQAPDGFRKSPRTSIFDEMYRIKWMVGGLAGSMGKKPDELREAYGLWSPERIVELTLRSLCGGKDLRVYREVPVRDIVTAHGGTAFSQKALEAEISSYEREKEENGFSLLDTGETVEKRAEIFFQYSRFDFVVCDKKDRVLLMVEADGEYHRNSERCRQNDILKNSIVTSLLKGRVFADNMSRLEDMWDESWPVCLLRLPNDGSTWLETEELRRDAEKELLENSFSIEKLLEKRMKSPEAENALYVKAGLWESAEEESIRENALWGLCELLYVTESEIKNQGDRNYLLAQQRVCDILRGETGGLFGEKKEKTEKMLFCGVLAERSQEELKEAIRTLKRNGLVRLKKRKKTDKPGETDEVSVLTLAKPWKKNKNG